MRTLVLAASLVLLSATTSMAAPWSITPPAGWADVSAEARARPEFQARIAKLTEAGGTTEIAVYRSGSGEHLTVTMMRMPDADGATRKIVRSFEDGLHNSVHGTDLSYTVQEIGNALVVDEVAQQPTGVLRSRRFAGVRGDELTSVAAFCVASEAICQQALASLQLDTHGFRPLSDELSAYELGYRLGRLAVPLVLIVGLVLFLVRRRRQR